MVTSIKRGPCNLSCFVHRLLDRWNDERNKTFSFSSACVWIRLPFRYFHSHNKNCDREILKTFYWIGFLCFLLLLVYRTSCIYNIINKACIQTYRLSYNAPEKTKRPQRIKQRNIIFTHTVRTSYSFLSWGEREMLLLVVC